MGSSGAANGASYDRFVIHHGAKELPLRPGSTYLIGRSTECQILLADQMVSRRHARLVVGVNLLLEDLGSANGVYVDGKRIQAIRRLTAGQRIQIGAQELIVGSWAVSGRYSMPTQSEVLSRGSVPASGERARAAMASNPGPTDRVNFPEILLELTGRLLKQSRSEEAEKLVEEYLRDILANARQGTLLEGGLSQHCAERALALAAATGKSSWLDYVFELYAAMNSMLPETLINESYRVVRLVRRPSLMPIRNYVRRMESQHATFGPSERFLLKRLRGLEQMVSAR